MRAILFKGKRKDNGEWVEGFLFDDGLVDSKRWFIGSIEVIDAKYDVDNCLDIYGHCIYEVDPETVCQYTGLKDRNGKKIFEGDIVKIKFREGRVGSLEKEYNYVVRYDGSQASFEFEGHDELLGCPCLVQQNQHTFEVIGNVFDHKEFLNED